jgi:hypothetical protein
MRFIDRLPEDGAGHGGSRRERCRAFAAPMPNAKGAHCNGSAFAAKTMRDRGTLRIATVQSTRFSHAEFLLTVANDEQLPPPGPPEIAFAGRSNAGKSSAINALANRSRLAFTSKTPGRTQQINFFRLRGGALLTDLPGYGFAAVPKALKRHWQGFLARYVASRSRSSEWC